MSIKADSGIEFVVWPVGIIAGDEKIKQLISAQGWTGFGIYFFLCQMAAYYHGYFIRWSYSDATITAKLMGGGIRSETVKATVGACLQIGLFEKRLFVENGVLTNKELQKNYLSIIKEGGLEKLNQYPYWLLENEKSRGLVKCAQNEELQDKSEDPQIRQEDTPQSPPSSSPPNPLISIPPIIPPEEKGRGKRVRAGEDFPDVLREALDTWVEYKREKGLPYPEIGLRMLREEARRNMEAYGAENVARVIRESMASGYTGIVFSRLREEAEKYGRTEDSGMGNTADVCPWEIKYDVDGRAEP